MNIPLLGIASTALNTRLLMGLGEAVIRTVLQAHGDSCRRVVLLDDCHAELFPTGRRNGPSRGTTRSSR